MTTTTTAATATRREMADETIMRINTTEPVAKTTMLEKLRPWLTQDANLKDSHYQRRGKEVDKFFTLKFLGTMEEASRRLEQAHTQLREIDGSWKDFSFDTPQGTNCKIYISKDKTKSQILREKAGKRLLEALRTM